MKNHRVVALRLTTAAFVGSLFFAAACGMDPSSMMNGCGQSSTSAGTNAALQTPDRVCAPGTHLDSAKRMCVAN